MLRPAAGVGEVYRNVQDAALARLGNAARRPRTRHVTLREFYEPERRDGKTLDAEEWSRFAQAESRTVESAPTEIISEAELVWYQDGIEHAEVLPLGG